MAESKKWCLSPSLPGKEGPRKSIAVHYWLFIRTVLYNCQLFNGPPILLIPPARRANWCGEGINTFHLHVMYLVFKYNFDKVIHFVFKYISKYSCPSVNI